MVIKWIVAVALCAVCWHSTKKAVSYQDKLVEMLPPECREAGKEIRNKILNAELVLLIALAVSLLLAV